MGALDDNCKYFTGINPSFHMNVVLGTENALIGNSAARNSVWVSVACEASAGLGLYVVPQLFLHLLCMIVAEGGDDHLLLIMRISCQWLLGGCGSRSYHNKRMAGPDLYVNTVVMVK